MPVNLTTLIQDTLIDIKINQF